jgi:diguanylate cyclase (GGDEF)-like protein/PAS domain S-box-containing protein
MDTTPKETPKPEHLDLETILLALPAIVYLVDLESGQIIFRNLEFNRYYQLDSMATVREAEIDQRVVRESWNEFEEHRQKVFSSEDGQTNQAVFRLSRPDGAIRWMKLRSSVYQRDAGGQPRLVLHMGEDVTEHHQYLSDHVYWSTHDYLTGLANRSYFENRARKISSVKGLPAAILMIDMDGLKSANDRLGHAQGDDLLLKARDAMQAVASEGDIVARLGGDEFAILHIGAGEHEAIEIKNRLQQEFAEQVQAWGMPELGLSVGISPFLPGMLLDEAMQAADAGMYRDKRRRRRQNAARNRRMKGIVE